MTTPTVPPEMLEALETVERIGGRALVTKIAGLFEQGARERIARLETQLADGDRAQLARTAHAIKGSAAQVGASALRDLAAMLERDAHTVALDDLPAQVAAIAAAIEQTILALHAHGSAVPA